MIGYIIISMLTCQGYNVAPSTLAYFPASMETSMPVCHYIRILCSWNVDMELNLAVGEVHLTKF